MNNKLKKGIFLNIDFKINDRSRLKIITKPKIIPPKKAPDKIIPPGNWKILKINVTKRIKEKAPVTFLINF